MGLCVDCINFSSLYLFLPEDLDIFLIILIIISAPHSERKSGWGETTASPETLRRDIEKRE